MLKTLGYGMFLFYGMMTFGGFLFVWFVVPETKRLTLEEMDVLFGSVGTAQAVGAVMFVVFVIMLMMSDRMRNAWTKSTERLGLMVYSRVSGKAIKRRKRCPVVRT